ncbi:MAG: hypothetical protein P4M02_09730 [Clostridia bacterium]|nr:hypothetical protein [Clostridia bacterium]
MSSGRSTSADDDDENEGLVESLRDNIGKVITVFTRSGGCSGSGFTGLLIQVNDCSIKLVTSLPSAPRNPFGVRVGSDNFNGGGGCRSGNRMGSAIIIPIRQIVSFVFNDV